MSDTQLRTPDQLCATLRRQSQTITRLENDLTGAGQNLRAFRDRIVALEGERAAMQEALIRADQTGYARGRRETEAAAVRERCAALCEQIAAEPAAPDWRAGALRCAGVIRGAAALNAAIAQARRELT